MARLEISDLEDSSRFTLLRSIGFADVAPFVVEYYWRKRTRIIWAFDLILLIMFLAWVAIGVRAGLTVDGWLTNLGFAVLAFFVLIPVHEFIHGATYKRLGATDVRYGFSLRKGYAYAIAHDFVVNRREFTWVALMPFLLINTALLAAAIVVEPLRMLLIAAMIVHTTGASGDCALLNFLWINRTRELYTYDDATANTSYFYARNEA